MRRPNDPPLRYLLAALALTGCASEEVHPDFLTYEPPTGSRYEYHVLRFDRDALSESERREHSARSPRRGARTYGE